MRLSPANSYYESYQGNPNSPIRGMALGAQATAPAPQEPPDTNPAEAAIWAQMALGAHSGPAAGAAGTQPMAELTTLRQEIANTVTATAKSDEAAPAAAAAAATDEAAIWARMAMGAHGGPAAVSAPNSPPPQGPIVPELTMSPSPSEADIWAKMAQGAHGGK